MTPEQQRIAIAEACGWKREDSNFQKDRRRLVSPNGNVCIIWKDGGFGGEIIPDYLNDLNAMHEAEKVLGPVEGDAFSDYHHLLRSIAGSTLAATHATAPQRAEAFLRTIGKWVDE